MSREVANLTERKIHTPKYGVKEFVCWSVCLSVTNFDLYYLWTGRIKWSEIFLEHLCQKAMSQNYGFPWQGVIKAGAEGQIIIIFLTTLMYFTANFEYFGIQNLHICARFETLFLIHSIECLENIGISPFLHHQRVL